MHYSRFWHRQLHQHSIGTGSAQASAQVHIGKCSKTLLLIYRSLPKKRQHVASPEWYQSGAGLEWVIQGIQLLNVAS